MTFIAIILLGLAWFVSAGLSLFWLAGILGLRTRKGVSMEEHLR